MSTDEQIKEIGKLALRRADARRQSALLHARLQEAGKTLNEVGRLLMPEYPNSTELQKATTMLSQMSPDGGLERIITDITEYVELTGQLSAISRSLKDAGAE